jgi:hypothetical protein
VVDDSDYAWLSQFKWCVSAGYAMNAKMGSMHRLLAGAKHGQCVDHVNGDKLDNRRSNLRIATHSENSRNRKRPKTNTSGFKGVSWHVKHGKGAWRASIWLNGKNRELGRFASPQAAHEAYASAAAEHYGAFARMG